MEVNILTIKAFFFFFWLCMRILNCKYLRCLMEGLQRRDFHDHFSGIDILSVPMQKLPAVYISDQLKMPKYITATFEEGSSDICVIYFIVLWVR